MSLDIHASNCQLGDHTQIIHAIVHVYAVTILNADMRASHSKSCLVCHAIGVIDKEYNDTHAA